MGKPESGTSKAHEAVIRKPLTNAQFIDHSKAIRAEIERRLLGLKSGTEIETSAPADPALCQELFALAEATQKALIANNCQPL